MATDRREFTLSRKLLVMSAIAGLRAASAPALLAADLAHRQPAALKGTPFAWLMRPRTAAGLKLAALGEFAGDKLPTAPNRIAWYSLLGRAISGGLVGAVLSAEEGHSRAAGFSVGGALAIAAAYVGFFLRRSLSRNTPLPDAFYGAAEDVAVLIAGLHVITE
jgi:uncharacterized membrane protein